ncbi:pyridoxal phosphate-dependent aminotransferase [Pelagovum pacificum]|uniref:Aminotransferase n=1 Tax=Pelagovum pacificum TaxID=2588711 RepID=A0A5C5GBX7_9RHOB|nr:aminotransferase class I/II-fold pyridoxal phosphate-dependent enzyme [Pelagovum pacificum]QQA44734.1 aminotransferase class I/II-fold pyridoxal phosphate-dependent enzyme [Pelagovum pacificum]TNY32158.1 aminotransferase class I/II-fold pyridoxal phosphate-dependent enzyme [Pelagovum pacificum]
MKTSSRGQVDPFIVMDIAQAAAEAEAEGRPVIHMEIGQPGTGAPRGALDGLSRDMSDGPLGYSVALGIPELRRRIAHHYGTEYDVDLDPARVVITAGASGAFILAFSALFDTGARVGLGEPCYPSYRQILKALDLVPVGIPTTLDTRMQPVARDVSGHALDGLLVASPANPTGTMLGHAELTALSDACLETDTSLISDEIYHGLTYGARATSALEVTDEVYVINSFSKYFSMTGWRVGWMVVPPDHVRIVERLAQNLFICPPHASQRLALHAFDCREELDANVAVYAENRRLMLEELPKAGFRDLAPPDGAFYIYADVSDFTDDALAFSHEILEVAGVAVTPGIDFDPERGRQWLRFSYAQSTDAIREGLRRLTKFMDDRKREAAE